MDQLVSDMNMELTPPELDLEFERERLFEDFLDIVFRFRAGEFTTNTRFLDEWNTFSALLRRTCSVELPRKTYIEEAMFRRGYIKETCRDCGEPVWRNLVLAEEER